MKENLLLQSAKVVFPPQGDWEEKNRPSSAERKRLKFVWGNFKEIAKVTRKGIVKIGVKKFHMFEILKDRRKRSIKFETEEKEEALPLREVKKEPKRYITLMHMPSERTSGKSKEIGKVLTTAEMMQIARSLKQP